MKTLSTWKAASIFAISSYQGSVPTFKILIEDGAVFSYVPSEMIRVNKDGLFQTVHELKIDDFWFESCKKEKFPCYKTYYEWQQKNKSYSNDKFFMLSSDTLNYENCPSENMSLNIFSALEGEGEVFIKEYGMFIKGQYKCTVDWGDANVLLHLMLLENGQFVFMPSHKILFKGNPKQLSELPKYKAVKGSYKK